MSYKAKGNSLPPLEDVSFSGRSPRQRRRKTSYEYKSGSSSPTTPSPRSPFSDKDSPRQRDTKPSPRTPVGEVNKEFRTLCIGSPIPDTDPHADDMLLTSTGEKRSTGRQTRNKGNQRAPSITIDKVEELHLVDAKSPRGGRPISPASYELIEHSRSTTPFSKSHSNERLLSIEPSTPPVERKGNRQVINYYREKDGDVNRSRSDGNIPDSSSRDTSTQYRRSESKKHTRSQTEGGNLSEHNKKRGKSPPNSSRRDLTPSPRLTRRARENEQTSFTKPAAEDRDEYHRKNERRQRDSKPGAKRRDDRDGENEDEESSPPSDRRRQRYRRESNDSDNDDNSPRSPRDEVKKPVRLEPLNLRNRKK